MQEIKIKSISNGYVLSWKEANFLGNKNTTLDIQEVIENNNNKKEGLKKLLENIADYFGFCHNEYSNDNLKITFDKKGHEIR